MTLQNWVVVADSHLAKIYTHDINGHREPLKLLHTLEHPESKLRDQDLVSDLPGHFKTSGTSRGAFSPRTEPKEVEIDKFALQIANLLDQGRVQNQFKNLFIFADPRFYGMMGTHMTKHVKDMIKKVVHKDYTHLTENQLQDEILKK